MIIDITGELCAISYAWCSIKVNKKKYTKKLEIFNQEYKDHNRLKKSNKTSWSSGHSKTINWHSRDAIILVVLLWSNVMHYSSLFATFFNLAIWFLL